MLSHTGELFITVLVLRHNSEAANATDLNALYKATQQFSTQITLVGDSHPSYQPANTYPNT